MALHHWYKDGYKDGGNFYEDELFEPEKYVGRFRELVKKTGDTQDALNEVAEECYAAWWKTFEEDDGKEAWMEQHEDYFEELKEEGITPEQAYAEYQKGFKHGLLPIIRSEIVDADEEEDDDEEECEECGEVECECEGDDEDEDDEEDDDDDDGDDEEEDDD